VGEWACGELNVEQVAACEYRPLRVTAEVLGAGRLGHFDSQLAQFAMDARGAPRRIGDLHRADQGAKVGGECRATNAARA